VPLPDVLRAIAKGALHLNCRICMGRLDHDTVTERQNLLLTAVLLCM
jgi:hypothetical protein